MLAGQHTQTSPPGQATVSCLLEVNGEFYALGPAHLFTHKITAKIQEQLLAELRQMDEDEDEGDDITFDDDDDGYSDNNHSPPNGLMSEEESLESNATSSPPKVLDDPSSDKGGLEDLVARYPGPKDLEKDTTDCDWAITQVKKPDQQLPNLYLAEGRQAPEFRGQHIVKVAVELSKDTQPINVKSVNILTSSSTKYGTLLPQIANISGLSGRGHCNVHVVRMKNRNDIELGDSGALVVDAQTSVAYGHVVATSPQGEAYVVPLHATLCQVKTFFNTDNVRLPESLDMLGRMVLHYVTTEAFAEAEKVILAMTSMVKRLRVFRLAEGRKRLTYWLKDSTVRTALLGLDFQKDTNDARREEWLKLGEDWKMFVVIEDQTRSSLDAAENGIEGLSRKMWPGARASRS
ncbi:uncharacterized protein J4E87_005062 [Alternaria ethzedia]|uniref:uncharacterized protein n=1 Tax=Alternaria ethzedia TaxID=181014 RepID=UPI0020C2765E|nr:uncharacterized protein J4E87_005062 [Alternaria ethzedia]KAI4625216.1 hypothetical protein J4E87_005062 [Alternaria ethzedia]